MTEEEPTTPHEDCSDTGAHPETHNRTFSLNSPEFYEAVCGRRERPWIPNGALPREPNWPRQNDGPSISAGDDGSAQGAFREWLGHVQAGRIGERRD